MRRILIVSPDPGNARMLALAFELDGWDATHKTALPHKPEGVDALVVDLVEGMKEAKGMAKRMDGMREQGAKTVVILPRGYRRERAEKEFNTASLVVPRPFHLMRMVTQVENLFE